MDGSGGYRCLLGHESRLEQGRTVIARSRGRIDRTTGSSEITTTYDDAGSQTVLVTVVDEENATNSTQATIRVVSPGGGFLPPCGTWCYGLPLLLIPPLAYRYGPRKIPGIFGGAGPDVQNYAIGAFETPTDAETVAVGGLGFEPELVVLTANNGVTAGKDGTPTRSDGWSYGAAKRQSDGSVIQHVVSVADDRQSTGDTLVGVHEGKAIDIYAHGGEQAGSLAGTVERTTQDGFEVTFDRSALPEGVTETYVVGYQAFETGSASDVDLGYFRIPEAPGTQEVPLRTDAEHVSLTAISHVDGIDQVAVGDDPVGISRGTAAPFEDGIVQTVASHALSPGFDGRSARAAYDDRALHLLSSGDTGVEGRTSARVTDLGETLELSFDTVHDAGGEVVTYVATNTGKTLPPGVGAVRAPDHGETVSVDVGFEPEFVELTTVDVPDLGEESSGLADGMAFGWSHGTAMPLAEGGRAAQILHGSAAGDEGRPEAPTAGVGPLDPMVAVADSATAVSDSGAGGGPATPTKVAGESDGDPAPGDGSEPAQSDGPGSTQGDESGSAQTAAQSTGRVAAAATRARSSVAPSTDSGPFAKPDSTSRPRRPRYPVRRPRTRRIGRCSSTRPGRPRGRRSGPRRNRWRNRSRRTRSSKRRSRRRRTRRSSRSSRRTTEATRDRSGIHCDWGPRFRAEPPAHRVRPGGTDGERNTLPYRQCLTGHDSRSQRHGTHDDGRSRRRTAGARCSPRPPNTGHSSGAGAASPTTGRSWQPSRDS